MKAHKKWNKMVRDGGLKFGALKRLSTSKQNGRLFQSMTTQFFL